MAAPDAASSATDATAAQSAPIAERFFMLFPSPVLFLQPTDADCLYGRRKCRILNSFFVAAPALPDPGKRSTALAPARGLV
jgi:hypothetical protein